MCVISMEGEFQKLLSHAKADIDILSKISGGVSKHKTLGGSTHARKSLGGGGRFTRPHSSRSWWSPPKRYMGKTLGPHQNVHDLYHQELKKWKGKPEDFQEVFQHRLSGG